MVIIQSVDLVRTACRRLTDSTMMGTTMSTTRPDKWKTKQKCVYIYISNERSECTRVVVKCILQFAVETVYIFRRVFFVSFIVLLHSISLCVGFFLLLLLPLSSIVVLFSFVLCSNQNCCVVSRWRVCDLCRSCRFSSSLKFKVNPYQCEKIYINSLVISEHTDEERKKKLNASQETDTHTWKIP